MCHVSGQRIVDATGTHIDDVAGTRPLHLSLEASLVARLAILHPMDHCRAIVRDGAWIGSLVGCSS